MNNPFFAWYFQVYELSAAFWLETLATAGRYPQAPSDSAKP